MHAWSETTRQKYSSGIERYKKFCVSRGFPEHECFPASEKVLCSFVATFAGTRAGSTIRNDLAAVRAWHIINALEFPSTTRLVYALKGASNMTPASSKRDLRPPMTVKKLSILRSNIDVRLPLDAAVFFAATTAFFGQLRLGELLPPNERIFDATRTPAVRHVLEPNGNGSRRICLPYTKVAKGKGEQVIICRQHLSSDPIHAYENHLAINRPSPDDPLCGFRDASGKIRPLTKSRFMKRCNEIWVKEGLPRSTGHEFRIGGTTHLLLSKVPPDVVKMMGRWSSDAFQRYWRQIEILAPLYAEYLKPLKDLHSRDMDPAPQS